MECGCQRQMTQAVRSKRWVKHSKEEHVEGEHGVGRGDATELTSSVRLTSAERREHRVLANVESVQATSSVGECDETLPEKRAPSRAGEKWTSSRAGGLEAVRRL